MTRARPGPRFGPEGVGKVRLGSAVSVYDLPGFLAWYERLAGELKAGQRQVVVDGVTLAADAAGSLADRLLKLVEQARRFPGQVREGWERLQEDKPDRRERRRRLAQVPDVIIDDVSEAYVAGITLGALGARVAAEELRTLVDQQLERSRAGGRGRGLEARGEVNWSEVRSEFDRACRDDPAGFRVGRLRDTWAKRLGCSPRTIANHIPNPKVRRAKIGR